MDMQLPGLSMDINSEIDEYIQWIHHLNHIYQQDLVDIGRSSLRCEVVARSSVIACVC